MKNRWNADAIGKWAANIIGKRGDAIDRAVVMVISPLQKRTGNVASKGTTPDLSMGAFSPAVGKFDFCINTWRVGGSDRRGRSRRDYGVR